MALGPDSILLTDRVALVTGGAQGIGAATAVALAAFGADVAICDRDADGMARTAAAVEAAGRRCLTGELDVREGDAVDGFAGQVGERHGHLDVLVNNAGGGFYARFMDVSAKGQDALVRENYLSVTNFVRACVPLMDERGASIVNITSIEAHRAGPGFAVYSSMKAAVASLTRSLALELADRRIRVNCVAPDVIPTGGEVELGEDADALERADVARQPWPDDGEPDDVAAAVVFLAGGMSRFVTGATIHVDGGNWASGGWRRDAGGRYVL